MEEAGSDIVEYSDDSVSVSAAVYHGMRDADRGAGGRRGPGCVEIHVSKYWGGQNDPILPTPYRRRSEFSFWQMASRYRDRSAA